jgi:hypothetical protein
MRYRVRNWSEYQHYKDRNPPWIKLHYSMLSSEDWVLLDDRSRVLAIACMLIASRNNGEVPGNPEFLKRVAYLNTKPNFKPLIECGFLEVASGCKQMLADARPETETETETEGEKETEARKRAVFVKPTVEQVAEYCRARGNAVDAEEFVDHYTANGWVRGKTKISDWKACVRTWEKNKREKSNGTSGKPVWEQPHERRARELAEAIARAEGAESLAADEGDLRGQVLEGVWSRAE